MSKTNENTLKKAENAVSIIKKFLFNAIKPSLKKDKGDNIKKTPTHFFDIIPC